MNFATVVAAGVDLFAISPSKSEGGRSDSLKDPTRATFHLFKKPRSLSQSVPIPTRQLTLKLARYGASRTESNFQSRSCCHRTRHDKPQQSGLSQVCRVAVLLGG